MVGRRSARDEPPTLALDLDSPFRGMHYTVQMNWKQNAKRNEILAKLGVGFIGHTNSELPDRWKKVYDMCINRTLTEDSFYTIMGQTDAAGRASYKDLFNILADGLHTDPNQKIPLKNSHSDFGHKSYVEVLNTIREKYTAVAVEDLLQGARGFTNAARAPSIDEISGRIFDNMTGEPMLAGFVLCTVATIAEHHPNLTASVNRACEIIEGLPAIRASERKTKQAWKNWRDMSPLWAGLLCVSGDVDWQEMWRKIRFFEDIDVSVAYAKWFCEFATTHIAKGSSVPLVPEDEIVRISVPVEPKKPALDPLPDSVLKIAEGYMAATIRKSD